MIALLGDGDRHFSGRDAWKICAWPSRGGDSIALPGRKTRYLYRDEARRCSTFIAIPENKPIPIDTICANRCRASIHLFVEGQV